MSLRKGRSYFQLIVIKSYDGPAVGGWSSDAGEITKKKTEDEKEKLDPEQSKKVEVEKEKEKYDDVSGSECSSFPPDEQECQTSP